MDNNLPHISISVLRNLLIDNVHDDLGIFVALIALSIPCDSITDVVEILVGHSWQSILSEQEAHELLLEIRLLLRRNDFSLIQSLSCLTQNDLLHSHLNQPHNCRIRQPILTWQHLGESYSAVFIHFPRRRIIEIN